VRIKLRVIFISVYQVTYNIYCRIISLVPELDVGHRLLVYSVATFNVSSD